MIALLRSFGVWMLPLVVCVEHTWGKRLMGRGTARRAAWLVQPTRPWRTGHRNSTLTSFQVGERCKRGHFRRTRCCGPPRYPVCSAVLNCCLFGLAPRKVAVTATPAAKAAVRAKSDFKGAFIGTRFVIHVDQGRRQEPRAARDGSSGGPICNVLQRTGSGHLRPVVGQFEITPARPRLCRGRLPWHGRFMTYAVRILFLIQSENLGPNEWTLLSRPCTRRGTLGVPKFWPTSSAPSRLLFRCSMKTIRSWKLPPSRLMADGVPKRPRASNQPGKFIVGVATGKNPELNLLLDQSLEYIGGDRRVTSAASCVATRTPRLRALLTARAHS